MDNYYSTASKSLGADQNILDPKLSPSDAKKLNGMLTKLNFHVHLDREIAHILSTPPLSSILTPDQTRFLSQQIRQLINWTAAVVFINSTKDGSLLLADSSNHPVSTLPTASDNTKVASHTPTRLQSSNSSLFSSIQPTTVSLFPPTSQSSSFVSDLPAAYVSPPAPRSSPTSPPSSGSTADKYAALRTLQSSTDLSSASLPALSVPPPAITATPLSPPLSGTLTTPSLVVSAVPQSVNTPTANDPFEELFAKPLSQRSPTASAASSAAQSATPPPAKPALSTSGREKSYYPFFSPFELSPVTNTPWQEIIGGVSNVRNAAAREIVETERAYVSDLRVVVEVYYNTLIQRKAELGISHEDLSPIFLNIEQILIFNQQLLDAMSRSPPEITKFGALILETAEFFKIYGDYCAFYMNAIDKLKALRKHHRISQLLDKLRDEHAACKGRSLENLLVKPWQRITKYPLLIEALWKHTPPEHEDYAALQRAVEKLKEVAHSVNEHKRLSEAQAETMALQRTFLWHRKTVKEIHRMGFRWHSPSRVVVDRVPVLKLTSKGRWEPRILFLFNDLLVLAAKDGDFHLGKAIIELAEAFIGHAPPPDLPHEVQMAFEKEKQGKFLLYIGPVRIAEGIARRTSGDTLAIAMRSVLTLAVESKELQEKWIHLVAEKKVEAERFISKPLHGLTPPASRS